MMNLLSEEQKQVILAIEEGKSLFVTGGAGTGKSFLLNFLRNNYSSHGFAVTASTGIAAVNISGSTIHSWAGIGLGNLPPSQILNNLFGNKGAKARHRILKTKTLAIDEISMISGEVFDLLNCVFQEIRQNKAPFGGMQILLFGDFLQLPPVFRNQDQGQFCFESASWHELNPEIFVLEEIQRQKDQKFVKILNNLRFGKVSFDDRDALKERVGAVDDNHFISATILTSHNSISDKINREKLQFIAEKSFEFDAEFFGEQSKIELLRKNCIASEKLVLKLGAQVMMTKNTYQKDGIINGSLGKIVDFSPKKNYPIVEFKNGKIITIKPEEWVIERFDEGKRQLVVDASMKQIPLILAWAITIHKSQGLTLDKISCDLSRIFAKGQAYVALSRARSLDSVFIQSIDFDRIEADEKALEFYLG